MYRNFLRIHTAWLLLSCVIGCKVYYPPLVYHKVKKERPYDAIVVPGFPYHQDKKNTLLKWRVLWVKHLYDNKICNNIIFSGGAVHTPYCESMIMAMYAEKLGIPRENIFVETMAEHTTDNVINSLLMAKELGFTRIGFATDIYQTSYIIPYIRRLSLDIDVLPMRYSKIRPGQSPEINASIPVAVDKDTTKVGLRILFDEY